MSSQFPTQKKSNNNINNNINKTTQYNLNNNNKKQSSFLIDFLLAGVAATIGKTSTAPLERVKLLLQNQHTLSSIEKKYSGMIDCLKKLIKAEGFISLWRGNTINVIRYFPNQALNFAFKDTFKKYFSNYDPDKEFKKFFIGNCLSGGLAGSISLMILHPIDLVRTRLATDNKSISGVRKFNGTLDCFKKVYLNEGGIKSLYTGIVVSIVGIFFYRALYFGGYDTVKAMLMDEKTNFFVKWIAAQSITIMSGMCMYPLDTIRRRIIVQSGEATKLYENSFDCVAKMYVQEGFKGYYKGFLTNAFRTCGSSIVLVLYDEFQKIAGVDARGKYQKD